MRKLPGSRRSLSLVLALAALGVPALAASPTAYAATAPVFPVPASERVHGTTPQRVALGTGTTTTSTAAPPAAAAANPARSAPVTPATTPGSALPTTTPVAPAGTPLPSVAQPKAKRTTKLSTGAIVAAALAVLLIILCLIWGAARWWAYEPRWGVLLRHSLAEASWRLSASWDEFSDWARIGR